MVTPGPLATAVATNVTGDPCTPPAVAVVVCCPSWGPRTRCTEARPSEPVWTVWADTLPPPCTAQVTVTPATPFPEPSVTSTTSGAGRAWPIPPLCPSPATFSSVFGGPRLSPAQRRETAVMMLASIQNRICRSRVIRSPESQTPELAHATQDPGRPPNSDCPPKSLARRALPWRIRPVLRARDESHGPSRHFLLRPNGCKGAAQAAPADVDYNGGRTSSRSRACP